MQKMDNLNIDAHVYRHGIRKTVRGFDLIEDATEYVIKASAEKRNRNVQYVIVDLNNWTASSYMNGERY